MQPFLMAPLSIRVNFQVLIAPVQKRSSGVRPSHKGSRGCKSSFALPTTSSTELS